jgi:Peptidase C39 family
MTPIASLSVPHYKQEQGASCTAACVRMVLAYYGRTHSEDELRQLLGTGPRGTPARNVQASGRICFPRVAASVRDHGTSPWHPTT